MPDETHDPAEPRTFLVEPSRLRADVVRYGLAMAVVLSLAMGLVLAAARQTENQDAVEAENAVTIDLLPAEPSSSPASEAADGPEQQAVAASPGQQSAAVEPPKPVDPPKTVEEPEPVTAPETPVDTPPPPVVPNPPAVLEPERAPTPPPKPVAAAATPAQEARAPTGAQSPVKTEADDGDEGRPPPSAHAITLWQRSLMKRLETAKRQAGREPHAAGTVKIAFEIAADGGLASERVAKSSGSNALDREALSLVRHAAPFPAPPGHAASRDTSFIVPVRFR